MDFSLLLLAFSGIALLSIGVLRHFTKDPFVLFIPAAVTALLLLVTSVFSFLFQEEIIKGTLYIFATILCGLFVLLLFLPPFRK
ncbi:hypothetical protein [Terribacillus sp. JSM ZJ617]|uniref:hypothetical protein n=1 Tax=Terribacillus sp. JSM ZJ617 TaxID=3342119 RepID=UPI0035A98032